MPKSAYFSDVALATGLSEVSVPAGGTNRLAQALANYANNPRRLVLDPGTYNEDFSSQGPLNGITIKGAEVVGVGKPSGLTNQAPSAYTTGMSVINMTAGTTAGLTTWQRTLWRQLVWTCGSGLARTSSIWNSDESFGMAVRDCLFYDMPADIIGVDGFGPDLEFSRNFILQSNAPPSGLTTNGGMVINLPAGPFWSRGNVFDFKVPAGTVSRYIGTAGTNPVAQQVYGPYYSIEDQFNPSGLYTQDTALDFEFGPSGGLKYAEIWRPFVQNMKLAYLTNCGVVRVIEPYQRINTAYDGTPGGGNPMLTMGGTSAGNFSMLEYLEVLEPQIIHDTNAISAPNVGRSVLSMGSGAAHKADYIGELHWRGGDIFINTDDAPTTVNTGLFAFNFSSSGLFSQVADIIDITDVDISFSKANTNPSLCPLLSLTSGATATVGRLRFGARLQGNTGGTGTAVTPGASPWTYTHGTTGATPAVQPGVVQISGGTVSEIDLAINGGSFVNTGVTAGAWFLNIGDQLKVTYSSVPTVVYYVGQAAAQPATGGDGTHALFNWALDLGSAGLTLTITDEEIEVLDMGALAAAAFTANRKAAGTYTATRRKVRAISPADVADTVTIGASPFTYTHGVTNYVTKGAPADGPALFALKPSAGTISSVTFNGATTDTATPTASQSYLFQMELGDVLVVTWATTAPTAVVAGKRRLGS